MEQSGPRTGAVLKPISAQTRLAGVIGDPVRHSLSPRIHNAAFAATNLDWAYLAFPVASGRGGEAIGAMDVLGIEGLSVTMPHKADVAKAVDRLTPSAERLGVCNCVFRDAQGRIWGDNTDGDGLVQSLKVEGVDVAGAALMVVGTGGAARSIIEALGRHGVENVGVVSRAPQRSMGELASLGSGVHAAQSNSVAQYDIIINASPIGMENGPDPDGLPVDTTNLGENHVVVDIVYEPRRTKLLEHASRSGARTINGVGMLVHQAAAQFAHWTGLDAPVDVMQRAGFELD